MSTETQNAQILIHLKMGKSITFVEALNKFGVMHLPRRIKDQKEASHSRRQSKRRARRAGEGAQ
jgi:S-adenosylmethionine:tRNA-ribosyltransferase-isomerase (queuine synthetase)